jgi:hypothetical protein
MMVATLTRIADGPSAEMVGRLLAVLLPDARTALDTTWGRGNFWDGSAGVDVVGCDISPHGRPAVVADFTRLPFRDGAFDAVIFDPPYLADAGKKSLIGRRFGTYRTTRALRAAIEDGATEAWRVARVGVIVKVMEQIHGSRLVRMTRWVEDAIPMDLYDLVYLTSPGKVEDPKWTKHGPQLSVRSNATVWLVWRKDGPVHKRRKVAG